MVKMRSFGYWDGEYCGLVHLFQVHRLAQGCTDGSGTELPGKPEWHRGGGHLTAARAVCGLPSDNA